MISWTSIARRIKHWPFLKRFHRILILAGTPICRRLGRIWRRLRGIPRQKRKTQKNAAVIPSMSGCGFMATSYHSA